MFKYWLISLIYFFALFFGGTLLITVLNYFNLISSNIISIVKIIIPILSIGVSGYVMGRHSKEKGYLSGIKIGASIILIFIILVSLFDKVSIKSILYYTILIFTSILGSMMGINMHKN